MNNLDIITVHKIKYVITEKIEDRTFPERQHLFCRRPNGRALWQICKYEDNSYSKARAISIQQFIAFKKKHANGEAP